jgi:hypothetical protein
MKKKKSARAATASTGGGPSKPVTTPAPPPPPSAKQPAPAVATSGFKAFILLVAGIIGIFIIFGLENNKLWFNERVLAYWDDFKEQKLNLDIEERKLSRYQTDYIFAKNITAFFEKRGVADKVLVLLPSTDYFNAHGLNIHVPEPAVFYYYTGLKTIWANSPEASQANWYITTRNGGLVFDSVTNKAALMDTIAAFKKYKISL